MAEETAEELSPFKVNDRVARKGKSACTGTVKELRKEVTATSGDVTSKALMVVVHWDNGTNSYLTPEALESSAS